MLIHRWLAVAVLVVSCNRTSPATNPGAARIGTGAATGHAETIGEPSTQARPSTLSGSHVVLSPGGRDPVTVRVEVVRTPSTRQRGLMNRRELDEMAGMLFVFPVAEHQAFWMHDTYLPLDMVFITSERRVLGVVQNATPMTDDSREVDGTSQYVLEVRAGFAARHHISAGTPVEFINVPPATE